jgi:hypothetical protein
MRHHEMKPDRAATRLAALTGVLCACLSIPAPAEAARRPITGKLSRPGVVVVALAADGSASQTVARPGFRLRPPAEAVTLQLREQAGTYLGPVVVAGRDGRVTLGVRAGARLGRIELQNGYARVAHVPARGEIDPSVTARARGGRPFGAGNLGLVPGRASGPSTPGADPDADGIPNQFDVDDNGNLVPDSREHGTAAEPTGKPAARDGRAEDDSDTADAALIVAIAAAALAALGLLWQVVALRRRRRRRVEVDVRLGLPIYPQGGGDWSVFVEVDNGSEHPVRWVGAELELRDGRRLHLMHQPPGGEIPAVLQPHESRQTWAPVRILEQGGLDLTRRISAIVKLDGGVVVRSGRRRLVPRSARR